MLSPRQWPYAKAMLFRLDAERAHRIGIGYLARQERTRWGWLIEEGRRHREQFDSLSCHHMGIKFPNPLGLAAGMDKNAEAVMGWQAMGFGFIEIGSVTFHPQEGNPKPRMWRLPKDGALINRLGFNNDLVGAGRVRGRQAGDLTPRPRGRFAVLSGRLRRPQGGSRRSAAVRSAATTCSRS